MKLKRHIVSAAVGMTALIAVTVMANPAEAQRSGDRRGGNHDARPTSNDRQHAPAPNTRTTHTGHDDRGRNNHSNHNDHQRYDRHDRHPAHGNHHARHRGHINVDFGRRVPHTTHERVWVPGHYHTTTERVLVSAGHYDTKVIPARFEWVRHGNHYDRVCVEPERVVKVWHEAEYENRIVKKWVPGYYKTVTNTHYHRTRPSISIGGIFRF